MTYEERRKALTEKHSAEIASNVLYIELLGACLYSAAMLSITTLVTDLRYLAEAIVEIADELEAEDD